MANPPPRPPADGDRVALVLADAKLIGDPAAAKKHGISERTIRRWRVAAQNDRPDVAAAVAANVREARQGAIAEWKGVIDETISEAVAYIRWAAKIPEIDPNAPPSLEDIARLRPSAFMVQALTGAMKTLHEIGSPDGDSVAVSRPTRLVIKKAAGPSKTPAADPAKPAAPPPKPKAAKP